MMWNSLSTSRIMLPTIQHQGTYVSMELIVFGAALVCLAATSAQAQTCVPPICYVNGSTEIQCNNCPVGFGVAVEDKQFVQCQSSPAPRNTKCEPCIAGVNFSDTNDVTSKCLACLTCHSVKQDQTKPCTADSDAECVCKEGLFYYDNGSQSCFECTSCGEGKEEISPCTPTQNRKCGAQSIPPTTPGLPTTNLTTPIANTTSPTIGTSTDPGMSTEDSTKGISIPGWGIAVIVVAILIIIVIVCWLYNKKYGEASSTGQNCLNINFCIENQTNTFGITQPFAAPMNGHAKQPATLYHQVSTISGSEQNGVANGRNHAAATTTSTTTTTTDGRQHLQSVTDALDLSEAKLERLIEKLDAPDVPLRRDALMLADQNLDLSPETRDILASSSTKAADVLKLWVQKRKTKADLVQALRATCMGRDDIADCCEEDSTGS